MHAFPNNFSLALWDCNSSTKPGTSQKLYHNFLLFALNPFYLDTLLAESFSVLTLFWCNHEQMAFLRAPTVFDNTLFITETLIFLFTTINLNSFPYIFVPSHFPVMRINHPFGAGAISTMFYHFTMSITHGFYNRNGCRRRGRQAQITPAQIPHGPSRHCQTIAWFLQI